MMIETKQAIKRSEEAKMKTKRIVNSIPFPELSTIRDSVKKTFYMFLSWLIFLVTIPVSVEASKGSREQTKPSFNSEASKQNIAVMDIEAYGISGLERNALTKYIASELRKTGLVNIVESAKAKKIKNEIALQREMAALGEQTRKKCKTLGVSHVVTGRVSTFEQTHYLSFRLFDAESGSIEKAYSRTSSANVDGLLANIEDVAWDIAGLTGKVAYKRYNTDTDSEKSLNQKIKSLVKRHWIPLVGLSLAVGTGLAISAVSNDGLPEIGMPPAFPEVPNK